MKKLFILVALCAATSAWATDRPAKMGEDRLFVGIPRAHLGATDGCENIDEDSWIPSLEKVQELVGYGSNLIPEFAKILTGNAMLAGETLDSWVSFIKGRPATEKWGRSLMTTQHSAYILSDIYKDKDFREAVGLLTVYRLRKEGEGNKLLAYFAANFANMQQANMQGGVKRIGNVGCPPQATLDFLGLGNLGLRTSEDVAAHRADVEAQKTRHKRVTNLSSAIGGCLATLSGLGWVYMKLRVRGLEQKIARSLRVARTYVTPQIAKKMLDRRKERGTITEEKYQQTLQNISSLKVARLMCKGLGWGALLSGVGTGLWYGGRRIDYALRTMNTGSWGMLALGDY